MIDLNELLEHTQNQMQATVTTWNNYVSKIRTGRANASFLDRVLVNYYGSPTPLLQIAQISVPEANLIVIKPYDRHQMSEVVGGIHKADLGVNPVADAEVIRIAIPPLTEEIRKDLVKKMHKELEAYKVRVRNERRDALDLVKKDPEISENLEKATAEDIQDLTNKYIKILDDSAKAKEKEILTL